MRDLGRIEDHQRGMGVLRGVALQIADAGGLEAGYEAIGHAGPSLEVVAAAGYGVAVIRNVALRGIAQVGQSRDVLVGVVGKVGDGRNGEVLVAAQVEAQRIQHGLVVEHQMRVGIVGIGGAGGGGLDGRMSDGSELGTCAVAEGGIRAVPHVAVAGHVHAVLVQVGVAAAVILAIGIGIGHLVGPSACRRHRA